MDNIISFLQNESERAAKEIKLINDELSILIEKRNNKKTAFDNAIGHFKEIKEVNEQLNNGNYNNLSSMIDELPALDRHTIKWKIGKFDITNNRNEISEILEKELEGIRNFLFEIDSEFLEIKENISNKFNKLFGYEKTYFKMKYSIDYYSNKLNQSFARSEQPIEINNKEKYQYFRGYSIGEDWLTEIEGFKDRFVYFTEKEIKDFIYEVGEGVNNPENEKEIIKLGKSNSNEENKTNSKSDTAIIWAYLEKTKQSIEDIYNFSEFAGFVNNNEKKINKNSDTRSIENTLRRMKDEYYDLKKEFNDILEKNISKNEKVRSIKRRLKKNKKAAKIRPIERIEYLVSINHTE